MVDEPLIIRTPEEIVQDCAEKLLFIAADLEKRQCRVGAATDLRLAAATILDLLEQQKDMKQLLDLWYGRWTGQVVSTPMNMVQRTKEILGDL